MFSFQVRVCGGLSEKCPPKTHIVEHLVPSWMETLGGAVLLEEVRHCGWALIDYTIAPPLAPYLLLVCR